MHSKDVGGHFLTFEGFAVPQGGTKMQSKSVLKAWNCYTLPFYNLGKCNSRFLAPKSLPPTEDMIPYY